MTRFHQPTSQWWAVSGIARVCLCSFGGPRADVAALDTNFEDSGRLLQNLTIALLLGIGGIGNLVTPRRRR